MSQPASRSDLKEYALRRLGKPVLEINVDDDQIDDLNNSNLYIVSLCDSSITHKLVTVD